MKNELVEAQKKELGEIKFITPILSPEEVPATPEEPPFLPPAKGVENTGCMSGN